MHKSKVLKYLINYTPVSICDDLAVAGSVGTRTCNIFSFLFDWSDHLERYICWKPHLNRFSGSKVMSNWRVLRTIENNRNSFLFLAISHNQCCRLPTDPARSQQILLLFFGNPYYEWSLVHLQQTENGNILVQSFHQFTGLFAQEYNAYTFHWYTNHIFVATYTSTRSHPLLLKVYHFHVNIWHGYRIDCDTAFSYNTKTVSTSDDHVKKKRGCTGCLRKKVWCSRLSIIYEWYHAIL